MPNWEPAADRGLCAISDPQLSNPAKMRKKYIWVNIAVCPHLQLISHTQPTSTLSRIKCERYIFIKKCVRSFFWRCLIMFLFIVVLRWYNTPSYGLNSDTTIFLQGWLHIKLPAKVDIPLNKETLLNSSPFSDILQVKILITNPQIKMTIYIFPHIVTPK